MPFKMEVSLWHDGKNWIAKNQQIEVAASELPALDIAISEAIKQQQLFHKGSTVVVYMIFNQAAIPEWMRQYANHYFNRKVTLTI